MKYLTFMGCLFLMCCIITGCPNTNHSTNSAVLNAPSTVYLPTTGSVTLSVLNTSNTAPAQGISASNLPANVSSTQCNAAPLSACQITLTATGAAAATNIPITIQGSNTNPSTSNLSIEALQFNVSSTLFTQPGSETVTIINPTHFQINIGQIGLSTPNSNVSFGANTCGNALAPLAQCTIALNANANAYIPANSSLSVIVTNTGGTVGTGSVTIAPPQVTFGSNDIVLDNQNGSTTNIPLTLGSGFNLQNPIFHLYQQGTQTPFPNVTVTTNCPSVVTASSSCQVTLTNNAQLNPQNDATLTLTADNLTASQSLNVNVLNSVAINTESSGNSYYTTMTNGPRYAVISVTNTDPTETTHINAVTLSNNNAFSIVNRTTSGTDPFYGSTAQCSSTANSNLNQVNQLSPQTTCIIVAKGAIGNPSLSASNAVLTLNTVMGGILYNKVFNLTNTTYLYTAGDFYNLGSAAAGSNKLLAKCTNGQCQNFFGDSSSGANSRINILVTDQSGNLYAGGYFTSLGTATAGSHQLLAKCTGSTCQNFLGDTTSGADHEILTMAIDANQNLYVGGHFLTLGSASGGSSRLLAKCTNGSCANYFGNNSSGANAGIENIAIQGNTLYVGGFFNQLGTATANSNLLAQCSNGSCENYFGNNSTAGASGTITNLISSGSDLYTSGQFSSLGSATAGSNLLLAHCSNGTCQNYFGDTSSGANSYVFNMTTDQSGNLYVGGDLSSLASATSGVKLLAQCSGNSCQNYFGGTTAGGDSPVDILTTDSDGNLYAGGYFKSLGSATTNGHYFLLATCHNNDCQNFITPSSANLGADSGIFALAISNQISAVPQP